MFNFHIEDNLHIQDNLHILEKFHILDFDMNFYKFLYQDFCILEISISWKISLSYHIFVPGQSFSTQVWLVAKMKIS